MPTRRKNPVAKVPARKHSFLTPDRVLDVAYCYYVTSESDISHLPVGRLATSVVEDFERMCDKSPSSGRDWEFLFTCQQIVVSLSRGISRRKRMFEERLLVAEQVKDRQIDEVADSAKQAGIMRALMKTGTLGMAVFFAALFFSSQFEDNMKKETQPTYVSLATGLGAILAGAWFKSFTINRQVKKIFDTYEHAETHAYREYQQGALEEYLRAKRDAGRAWELYTERDAPEWPGFESVLEEELHLHKSWRDRKAEMKVNPVTSAMTWVRKNILQARSKDEVIEDHMRGED